MPRYTLIVFDRGVGYPEEMPILENFLEDEALCAAQCGPINVARFFSKSSKQEIFEKLKENEIEFMLTEETETLSNLPGRLKEHFDKAPKIKPDGSFEVGKKTYNKITLEEQLKAAEEKQDFEACAKIRDAIKQRDAVSEKTEKEKPKRVYKKSTKK